MSSVWRPEEEQRVGVTRRVKEELHKEAIQIVSSLSLEICKPSCLITWQDSMEGTQALHWMLGQPKRLSSLLEAPEWDQPSGFQL